MALPSSSSANEEDCWGRAQPDSLVFLQVGLDGGHPLADSHIGVGKSGVSLRFGGFVVHRQSHPHRRGEGPIYISSRYCI